MSDDLILARVGLVLATATERRQILRNQLNVVYDIYTVHYGFIGTNVLSANEISAIALSTRKEDQVDDTGTVGFDEMVTQEGLFGVAALVVDVATNGGVGLVASHTIPFTKPYTVPWLAAVFNAATAIAVNYGVDVWFVRRTTSAMEKAALVARLGGGRAQSPPS